MALLLESAALRLYRPAKSPSSLIVFSDDWGRHPSSCQHLTQHWLKKYSIDWVNTIGMRKPKFDLATVQRGVGKLKSWVIPEAKKADQVSIPDNLRVHSPKMWPSFDGKFGRNLNRKLLAKSLQRIVDLQPELPVVITTIPIVADLIDLVSARQWIYYCVDDFSEWPGLDGRTLERMEMQVIEKADRIICVSENLQEKMQDHGREASLLTHGVDLESWQSGQATGQLKALGLEAPYVLFWGVIDPRMDLQFLRHLNHSMKQGSIVLVGPEADLPSELSSLTRVHRIGKRPFAELPSLAQEANVLVMPYVDSLVTHAMQPLKLKEYLATGKPVVVRDLPANRSWADALDLAADAESFVKKVLHRLAIGIDKTQLTARERLIDESWSSKAEEFSRLAGWLPSEEFE
jgi:glycosyltransferase involved in cell wall biosynthesis